MPLLYRLRRSVALFVCPELSAEARLKATLTEARAMRDPGQPLPPSSSAGLEGGIGHEELSSADILFEAFGHVMAADDSWQATTEVLVKLRGRNLSLGGDDKAMCFAIVMLVAGFRLPVAEVGSR